MRQVVYQRDRERGKNRDWGGWCFKFRVKSLIPAAAAASTSARIFKKPQSWSLHHCTIQEFLLPILFVLLSFQLLILVLTAKYDVANNPARYPCSFQYSPLTPSTQLRRGADRLQRKCRYYNRLTATTEPVHAGVVCRIVLAGVHALHGWEPHCAEYGKSVQSCVSLGQPTWSFWRWRALRYSRHQRFKQVLPFVTNMLSRDEELIDTVIIYHPFNYGPIQNAVWCSWKNPLTPFSGRRLLPSVPITLKAHNSWVSHDILQRSRTS